MSLARFGRVARSVSRVSGVLTRARVGLAARAFSTEGKTPKQILAEMEETAHKKWMDDVKTYPVREILEHEMHATLEWVLPSPMPQHCFDQSPIVIEVKNRNPLTQDEH